MIAPALPDVPKPDAEILHLLQRVVNIGEYRGTFTAHDVTRVLEEQRAGICPVAVLPTQARTTTAWRPPRAPGRPREVSLTAAQGQILTALCEGFSNSEIAARRQCTNDTIKTHVRRLLAALGGVDRAQGVADVLTGRVQVWIRPARSSS
jgi:DNA-binding NarL/FixJ family response regulator